MCVMLIALHKGSNDSNMQAINTTCWFVHGRIKEKIDTIYVIKYQVYCIGNTVQWSANTVQLVCVNNPLGPPTVYVDSCHSYLDLQRH